MSINFNIVENEGEASSVVVFAGADQLIATKEHPNFANILGALRGTSDLTDEQVKGLFDVTAALSGKFARLSERVMARNGRVYLDGVEVDNALTKAIARYWVEGHDDLMPLVHFMEKIETNPNEHSKKNLFQWLGQHGYQLAPDGDFIAYKGVERRGTNLYSKSRGHGIVNGEEINGALPNVKDAIVEMPRTEVTHDPRIDCSTGLHVGNWRYASTFASTVIQVKINPRDVVSVPTDSNGEKMRVCRYRVLGVVTHEAKEFLAVAEALRTRYVTRQVKSSQAELVQQTADALAAKLAADKAAEAEAPSARRRRSRPAAPAKAAAKKAAKAPAKPKASPPVTTKPPVEITYPEHYEEFTKAHFQSLDLRELNWLQKEWEIKPMVKGKDAIITRLLKEARARKRTW